MNGFLTKIIIVWLGSFVNDPATLSPLMNGDSYYRAAIYSTQIDFSKANEIIPGVQDMLPTTIVIHKYYIQYGTSTLIEILDPGNEIKYLPVIVVKWDYSKKIYDYTIFMKNIRKYSTTSDTINFSIDESRGLVKNLCNGDSQDSKCDSVKLFVNASKNEYLVHYNEAIPNLPSRDLFYPDIKYLPSKIIGDDQLRKPMILEEVIYGKSAVDSLLKLFNYEGYTVFDNTGNPFSTEYVQELWDKMKKAYKKE